MELTVCRLSRVLIFIVGIADFFFESPKGELCIVADFFSFVCCVTMAGITAYGNGFRAH